MFCVVKEEFEFASALAFAFLFEKLFE